MNSVIAIHGEYDKPGLIPVARLSFNVAAGGHWVDYTPTNGKPDSFYGAYIGMSADSEETQRVYTFCSLSDQGLATYIDKLRAEYKAT